jgi:hypothetical protein
MVTNITVPFKVANIATTLGYSIELTLGSGGSYVGVPSGKKCIIHIGETREFVLKMTSTSAYDIIPVGYYDSAIGPPRLEHYTLTTDNTAGNLSITAAMVKGGFIVRDPTGGSRTDVLPTAAAMVALIPTIVAGTYMKFHVINNADAAETITFSAPDGTVTKAATNQTTIVIPQHGSGIVHMFFTSTAAYTYWVTAS